MFFRMPFRKGGAPLQQHESSSSTHPPTEAQGMLHDATEDHLNRLLSEIISDAGTHPQAPANTPTDPTSTEAKYANFTSPFMIPDSGVMMMDPHHRFDEDDLLLTPLVSPAMTPTTPFGHLTLNPSDHGMPLIPLTSPALLPHLSDQCPSPVSLTPSAMDSHRKGSPRVVQSSTSYSKKRASMAASPYIVPRRNQSSQSLAGMMAAGSSSRHNRTPDSSPACVPTPAGRVPGSMDPPLPHDRDFHLPSPTLQLVSHPAGGSPTSQHAAMTPSQLMQMAPTSPKGWSSDHGSKSGSSRPTPPSATPSLAPILPGGANGSSSDIAMRLATNSNYKNMIEGDHDLLGLNYDGLENGVESKRNHHKEAEQRRRDCLKACFEQLKTVLPPSPEKNPSKLQTLKNAYDYIRQLHQREAQSARRIRDLEQLVLKLQSGS